PLAAAIMVNRTLKFPACRSGTVNGFFVNTGAVERRLCLRAGVKRPQLLPSHHLHEIFTLAPSPPNFLQNEGFVNRGERLQPAFRRSPGIPALASGESADDPPDAVGNKSAFPIRRRFGSALFAVRTGR